ncbi:hypothetical protein [Pontibacter anaerobius]|uniref:Uncharacterized protein n=1 Tax=Pontibacter anaerobius TaxID=2993940 RepID=A0ABT3RH88_9BACT|nr:hypothetical protein [Pontibacter anaerobius]MCX2740769.1 hypothetical protein [Pontibacter anaerobius]
MIELLITLLIALTNPTVPANTDSVADKDSKQTSSTDVISTFGGTGTWIDK